MKYFILNIIILNMTNSNHLLLKFVWKNDFIKKNSSLLVSRLNCIILDPQSASKRSSNYCLSSSHANPLRALYILQYLRDLSFLLFVRRI